ncbi:hypothetical protein [Rhodococcus sp. ACT016]|uniref:hypothetical protein n=1 Tax=Rhodococcus sp. ACT016 TaxID=3134808 RepID=UPI003D2677C3
MVDDNNAGTSRMGSRAVAAWTFGLSVVSIVAAGVVVAGFLHSPEPELTTALPTTTPTTAPIRAARVLVRHSFGDVPDTDPRLRRRRATGHERVDRVRGR